MMRMLCLLLVSRIYHVLQDVFDPQGTPISPSTVVKTLLPTQYLRADMDSSGITRLGLGYGDDAASILETIATTTGVVHVIDGVLPLPRPFGTTLLRAGLSRFLEWLVAPSGLGPFYDGLTTRITVLAPTDGAIDASQLLNGTSPSRGLLSSLVGFHTIALPFTASDIARLAVQNNATLFNVTTTLPGEFLLLSTPDRGRIMRFSGRGNQAFMGISHADLVFSQGVIHVLDGVLVPSSAAIAAASSDNSTRLPLLGSID
ncbi:FAS1 domain-containing protein [Entophlyctis helioformis]|nr:FAS1 domain-containing protein [Entophlyctis helioformis]